MEHWYSKVQRQALIFVFKIKNKSFGWFCGSINCFFFIYHFWNYVEIGFIAKKWISSKFWTVQRRVNSCTSIQVVVQSFSWCPAILISFLFICKRQRQYSLSYNSYYSCWVWWSWETVKWRKDCHEGLRLWWISQVCLWRELLSSGNWCYILSR